VQSKELMIDIRNYVRTFNFIQNKYTFDYNYFILLVDLICFCNKEEMPSFTMTHEYADVLRRHIMYKEHSHIRLEYTLYLFFLDNINDDTFIKIRFLWGLMTPVERYAFICG